MDSIASPPNISMGDMGQGPLGQEPDIVIRPGANDGSNVTRIGRTIKLDLGRPAESSWRVYYYSKCMFSSINNRPCNNENG